MRPTFPTIALGYKQLLVCQDEVLPCAVENIRLGMLEVAVGPVFISRLGFDFRDLVSLAQRPHEHRRIERLGILDFWSDAVLFLGR